MTSKEKILEAALDLFCEKGYAETAMRELAAKTGLRVSSLYSHFGGKEEILDSILERYRRKLLEARIPEEDFDRITSELSLGEILAAGFGKITETTATAEMNKIVRLLVMEMYRNAKVREFYKEWYFDENRTSISKIFEGLKRKGKVKKIDTALLASLYGALLNYFYHEYFMAVLDGGDTAEVKETIQAQLGLFAGLIKEDP